MNLRLPQIIHSALLRSLLSIFLTVALPISVWADLQTSLNEMSSGVHSFRNLGRQFYHAVPVEKVEGSRLVLFNHEAAKALGLQLPESPAELEAMILDRFAKMVSKSNTGDSHWFATRYQDSNSKSAGSANGDGRALWSGKLSVNQDGQTRELDVMLKGTGATPLAWRNHTDPAHKDGLQSMREAVHSYVMSEAGRLNELNTTVDLAVIEVPLEKVDHKGRSEKAAITIRIGEQTRVAHLRYWADKPAEYLRMFDYIAARTLGLPASAVLTDSQRQDYLNRFAKNVANEAARYYDLHAVHGSTTSGNRTSSGATIDLGTFRYLDAHHSEYSYLFGKLTVGGKFGQVQQLKSYITQIGEFTLDNGLFVNEKQSLQIFDRTFKESLTDLWLNRLGLNDQQKLMISKSNRNRLFILFTALHEAVSAEQINVNGKSLRPGRFKPRELFKHSLSILEANRFQRIQAAYRIINEDRPFSFSNLRLAQKLASLVTSIQSEVNLSADDLMIAKQRSQNVSERSPLGQELGQSRERALLDRIFSRTENYKSLSEFAEALAVEQVDRTPSVNDSAQLRKVKLNSISAPAMCRKIFRTAS